MMAATTAAGAVREALAAATDALAAAGVDSPRLDAELLLEAATGTDRAQLAAHPEAPIAPAAGRTFGGLVRRRVRREPLAYVLGHRGFRRIELAVDRRVLIPRPETELLVEVALELRPRTVLDVGTGSGAVALAIADELEEVSVTATDTSSDAIAVARANAARLGLAERIRFEVVTGSGGHEGERSDPAPWELVVANLPYVSEIAWPSLAPEIRKWEPREALVAGADGLDAIRSLLARPPACRAIALEVGAGQAAAVGELLRGAGFPAVERRLDLAGIERVIVARP
jgi:release factor glutamine methyltransferase